MMLIYIPTKFRVLRKSCHRIMCMRAKNIGFDEKCRMGYVCASLENMFAYRLPRRSQTDASCIKLQLRTENVIDP